MATEDFLELLKAGSNQEELKRPLGRLRSRIAENYTKFLKSLSECVKDTKLTWTSPNPQRGDSAYLSKLQMREAIEILARFQEEEPLTFTITGTLIGASLKSKTFQIQTTEQIYSGAIADEAIEIEAIRNASLSKEYIANIQETTEKSETTGEITKPKYQLLKLST